MRATEYKYITDISNRMKMKLNYLILMLLKLIGNKKEMKNK